MSLTVIALAVLLRRPGDGFTRPSATKATTPTVIQVTAEAGDGASAVAAAVEYAAASQEWLYLSDGDVESAVERMAAPSVATELAADVVADIRVAREGLAASPGRVWWIVRPMAWRIDSLVADRARVDVWVVTVLSAVEVAVPQAEWMTVTVDLVWLDGMWQVEAVLDAPGPTPMTGPGDAPWDAQPFDEQLAGFTRLDSERG